MPTSHVDLIPTLMGLAGIDVERAAAGVAEHHTEAQPLPGRDLSGVIVGSAAAESVVDSALFHDRGRHLPRLSTQNMISGKPLQVRRHAGSRRVGDRHTADWSGRRRRAVEAQPLLRAARRLEQAHGIKKNPFAGPAAEPFYELHNLTADPEERHNRADDAKETLREMRTVLDTQRDAKRNLPAHRNPND